MYQLSRYAWSIVQKMKNHGYVFDALESHEGWLRFFDPYGGVISFVTWKAVKMWEKGIAWVE